MTSIPDEIALGSVQLNKYASGLYCSAKTKASSIDSENLIFAA